MKGTVIHRSPRSTQQQPPLCHVKLELSLLCAVFFPPLLVRRGAQVLAAQWEVRLAAPRVHGALQSLAHSHQLVLQGGLVCLFRLIGLTAN